MHLRELLSLLHDNVIGEVAIDGIAFDQNVAAVTADSRQVSQGSVFVAVRGSSFDGHRAIPDALARGACMVIVEEWPEGPLPVPTVHVKDSRLALAATAVALACNPSSKLRVYGVTGTNGKTTCATLLEQLFARVGRNVGFIGTTGNRYNGVEYTTNYSTPDTLELTRLFEQMSDSGVDSVCMEVSSHALDQHRVYGVGFKGAMFTNLTRDHLDYHGTMEKYANAKKRLFDGLPDDAIAVLWGESEWASYMKRHCHAKNVVMVGTGAGNHVVVDDIRLGIASTQFRLRPMSSDLAAIKPDMIIRTRLLGEFNVANAALVAVLAMLDGVPADDVEQVMPELHGPKGRMEVHTTSSGATAIVDYAHTPDALDNVLRVVRGFTTFGDQSRHIHVVFGCGGDRDKGKRSEMGRIAALLADHIYITTDNSRSESQTDIVNNIMGGIDTELRGKVSIIDDRREAIHAALDAAQPEDVVIIAGKGHEEYQIIGTERLPFSDAGEVEAWSGKHKKAPR